MLDIIEQTRSLSGVVTYDLLGGDDGSTAAQTMVPMLDWPTDLFSRDTVDGSEVQLVH
jgi:hypothetical protein